MTTQSTYRDVRPRPGHISILGVPVSVVHPQSAIGWISGWIGRKESRYVCVADVHSVVQGYKNPMHRASMRGADMIVPDGMPLVWTGRLRGESVMARVSGPDLLPAVCAHSAKEAGWRHYFFGGAEGVPERLAERLSERFPGLRVVGTCSPPFRALSAEEDAELVRQINEARPDIVWVGLGCPKQERWMAAHVDRIEGAVLIGVGAAFDFHVGHVKRAPLWMQRNGLEWVHRLASEPRRLWRRYLVLAPEFLIRASAEILVFRFFKSR
jgi:N-acetylglucosaminyldiphosphoundecaprenol N-acetyl-beta-D-mannosaminyltransferase